MMYKNKGEAKKVNYTKLRGKFINFAKIWGIQKFCGNRGNII